MSGFCPDCGNTQCICSEIAAGGVVDVAALEAELTALRADNERLERHLEEWRDASDVVNQRLADAEARCDVLASLLDDLSALTWLMGQDNTAERIQDALTTDGLAARVAAYRAALETRRRVEAWLADLGYDASDSEDAKRELINYSVADVAALLADKREGTDT